MSFDFPFILVCATVISGLIWLVDSLLWVKKRQALATANNQSASRPKVVEYARSFFPVLLIVLLIRSFVAQPFRVPTGSLEPTVQPVEFLLVNQFAYGLRLPVWHSKIVPISEPKRGDIVVFRWPVNPKIDFVKRVIGLPGDHISYVNKVLTINGKKASQKLVGYAVDSDGGSRNWPVKVMQENLLGVIHKIYVCAKQAQCPTQQVHNFYNLVVPKGHYFMMGDNRDNSEDSRIWGFVSEKALIGKAFLIWLSWDTKTSSIRWQRIGTIL